MPNKSNGNERVLSLNDQHVRDLAWILTCPQLMQLENAFKSGPLDWDWFDALDKEPRALCEHLSSKNLRMLGPYFEALWEFYLSHYPGKQLLAKNIQVFSDKVTVGEFDLIYCNSMTNTHHHLEVAVKYYLGYDASEDKILQDKMSSLNRSYRPNGLSRAGDVGFCASPMHYWLGPGTRDRLDKKVDKMVEHQSRLSTTRPGQAVLEQFGVTDIKPEICLLGYLFYPWKKSLMPPVDAGIMHQRGNWLRESQLCDLLGQGEYWQIMPKPYWLSPLIMPQSQLRLASQIQPMLSDYFRQVNRPILIGEFGPVGDLAFPPSRRNGYAMKQLYFVVPESWPHSNYTDSVILSSS